MPCASRWEGPRLGFQDFCSGQMGTNAASIKKIRNRQIALLAKAIR